MILLIPFDFALVVLAFRFRNEQPSQRPGWRACFLLASTALATVIIVMTEILGLFGWIHRGPVCILWATTGAVTAAYLYKRRRRFFQRSGYLASVLSSARIRLDWRSIITVAVLLLTLAATFVAGLCYAPNNFDSLTYHLSRVMHWIQNGTLAHYPTNITRQTYLTPGAEMLMMHVLVLGKGDWYAFALQWFCYLGCGIAASLVAGLFGACSRGQLWAAAFVFTLPMAILQASSTQNDLVASFWFTSLIYFGFCWVDKPSLETSLFLGSATGLALLSKGVIYLYAIPFALCFALMQFRATAGKHIKSAAVVLVAIVLINGGYFHRNMSLYGQPFADNKGLQNRVFSFSALASNVLRNAAFYLGTPSDELNGWMSQGMTRIHVLISGMNPSDPRTTYMGTRFEDYPRKNQFHEDLASSPLHFFILIGTAFLCLCGGENRRQKLTILALVVAALLFALILKWQPWHTRLHLPLFVAGAPVFGAVAARRMKSWASIALVFALAVLSFEPILMSVNRPLLPLSRLDWPMATEARNSRYSDWPPGLWKALQGCGCNNIGLVMNENWPEYLLLRPTFAPGKHDFRFEHLNVDNRSAELVTGHHFSMFHPCALIWIWPGAGDNESTPWGNPLYSFAWKENDCDIHLYLLDFAHGSISLGTTPDRWIYSQGRLVPEEVVQGKARFAYLTRGLLAEQFVRRKYGDHFEYSPEVFFADVPRDHPQFRFIQRFRADGLSAVPTGEGAAFGPNDAVTRYMLATVAVRALYGESFLFKDDARFVDVPRTHANYRYVLKAVDEGIMGVCSQTKFCPNRRVARQEVEKVIENCFVQAKGNRATRLKKAG